MRADPGPAVFNIPSNRSFGDALARGLIDQHGGHPAGLAGGIILLPSNRAKSAVQEAFVRASGGGLLLPRLVTIGDGDLTESVGLALDQVTADDPLPPVVDPLQRQLILARLIVADYARGGAPIDDAMAMQLADALGRALDQLLFEEVPSSALAELDPGGELAGHWERSLAHFRLLVDAWPRELARIGRIDLADRRNRLLDRVAAASRARPPAGFVAAAGITTAGPAVARLLRTVADLPTGSVVLPSLDVDMPDDEWAALGDMDRADAMPGDAAPWLESHPQFQLKLLLHRMGISRAEVQDWSAVSDWDGPDSRAAVTARLFVPARFTARWQDLSPAERAVPGLRQHMFASNADEAQGIALMMRQALETPGRTAALVTPDRNLAGRVAAALGRWGIQVDDSAGSPLSVTPPGVLIAAMADAAASGFAPVRLMALIAHPLVMAGEERLLWLDGVRALNRALRTPGVLPGLDGISRFLGELAADQDLQGHRDAVAALPWWTAARELLAPLETAFNAGARPLSHLVAALREGASMLAGNGVWSGVAGRSLADMIDRLERHADEGPPLVDPARLPAILADLMRCVAVRPPYGGHPRLFIRGLIEARLQRADLMILGGLNEGVWPQPATPDPWLAPGVRRALRLPSLDRPMGLAAHDFAAALGASDVVLTRSQREGDAPAVVSRFWLRLDAMTGGLPDTARRGVDFAALARSIDMPPGRPRPASRPMPAPPASARPRRISVTEVDRLAKDPFAYYAAAVLGLRRLDPLGAEVSAAWRGTRVHALLEEWIARDDCAPGALEQRIALLRNDPAIDAIGRAFWLPRIEPALRWAADRIALQRTDGRVPAVIEQRGTLKIGDIILSGKADRIDRMPDGSLVIVDYKTGSAPTARNVSEGFDRQLAMLGMIAERSGIDGVSGPAAAFEYWQLKPARSKGVAGQVVEVPTKRGKFAIASDRFVDDTDDRVNQLLTDYLLGDRPFAPSYHRVAERMGDTHHLSRRDEWFGGDDESAGDAP